MLEHPDAHLQVVGAIFGKIVVRYRSNDGETIEEETQDTLGMLGNVLAAANSQANSF